MSEYNNLTLNIDLSKIKTTKIFKWLKSKNISDHEMMKTFNCGVGFCLIVSNKNINKFYWNPELNKIDSNCINGVHIIINLAGSPIAQLWTKSSKKSILLSRTNSVKLLYQIILEKKYN